MSIRELIARLAEHLVKIVALFLLVCVVAMLTDHTTDLPGIGAVLIDLIEALIPHRA